MLDTKETAQIQMHLLYKTYVIYAIQDNVLYKMHLLFRSGRKPGGKIKTDIEQKQSLYYSNVSYLDGSASPEFYFLLWFLLSTLHTKKFPRQKMLSAAHVNIQNIFTQKMTHIYLYYNCEDLMLTSSFLPSFPPATH